MTLISRSGFRFLLIIVLLFLHLRPLLEQLFALYSLVFAKCSFASFLCLQLIKKTETKFILKSGKLKDRQKDHDKLHFLIYVYFYYTAFLTYRGILKVKPENPCHLGKCLEAALIEGRHSKCCVCGNRGQHSLLSITGSTILHIPSLHKATAVASTIQTRNQ